MAADQFDAQWYLQAYPDVAAAGADPWSHYINHGRFEGRLPCRNRALAWEYHLWRGGGVLLLRQLEQLADTSEASHQEQTYAAWAAARWYAANSDWPKALNCLQRFQAAAPPYPNHAGPYLLMQEAALQCGQRDVARKALAELQQRFPGQSDVALAEANLLAAEQGSEPRGRLLDQRHLEAINRIYAAQGLCALTVDGDGPLTLDTLRAADRLPAAGDDGAPRVSVIVPAYNAERTLPTALASLCEQSWCNLEILVVDDASTDATWQVLEDFVRSVPLRPGLTIRPLRHDCNRGAYAARNTALAEACGDLITTHDSDDWSHPQKIECQVRALLRTPDKVACTSHWVRVTDALHCSHWRPDDSWVYRNVSSLMFRRSVFEVLGYWDRVSVNADTEYYYRVLKAFGEDTLMEVLPGVPLSFGRIDNTSLSRCGETHLGTRFYGVRKDYEDAARRWHAKAAAPEDLYLPANPKSRPFLAPAAICRGDETVSDPGGAKLGIGMAISVGWAKRSVPIKAAEDGHVAALLCPSYKESGLTSVSSHFDPRDIAQQSGYFDAGWYLEQYPDLQEAPVDLFEHYWTVGASEGRDPGPGFSTSGYGYRFPEVVMEELPALHHFLTVGRAQGVAALAEIQGEQPKRAGAMTMLVCAHQAGEHLYGAERSLLDVLAALNTLGINLVVALPGAANADYVDAVRAWALSVAVLPYGWWKAGRAPNPVTLAQFECLIEQLDVGAVYTNTLVLDEPLRAARSLGVPTVIHVRELPEQDEALCRALGANASHIAARVREQAGVVVANSRAVQRQIAASNTVVVPNTVDMARFVPPGRDQGRNRPVRVALISSNLPKKGLTDFVVLAEKLEAAAVPVVCRLVGPDNEHTQELRLRQQSGEIPRNLQFAGYAAGPQDALAQADIVVNLSYFQESFGRTVLEAMAAGCPVVAYRWGALPELVEHGETGFLVPFGSVDAIADRVTELVLNDDLRRRLGDAGRDRAAAHFGEAAMLRQLETVLERIAPPRSEPQGRETRCDEEF